MANVQPDKFTRIANELMEVVPLFNFNGTQLRIILVLWRYTYGFKRKEHGLSISFLCKATGISKRQTQKEVNRLIDLNIINEIQKPSFNTSRIIGFNKDYDQWKIERSTTKEQQTIKKTEVNNSSTQQVNDSTPQQMNNSSPKKESIKENIKETPVQKIFEHYLSKNIIKHKKITSSMRTAIKNRLKDYDLEDILKAIDNYSTVLKSDNHYFSHKYPLADLMRDKDIRKFLDEAEPLSNFAKDGYKQPQQQSNPYRQEIDPETEELENQIAQLYRG